MRAFVMCTAASCLSMFVSGCATRETIPNVRVAANPSNIEVQDSHPHGPINLLGAIGAAPDVPSGTSTSLKRVQPLHNQEPRYFIAASGLLQVVSVERPKDYNTQYVNFQRKLKRWEQFVDNPPLTALEARGILYDGELQTEIPWSNAGRCFHAKLRFETFPWGRATMFLTTYVQGNTGGPVNNDMLVLVVQGFTNDSRYAINGHFAIRQSKLPESLWDKKTTGKAVFDIDHEDKAAEAWLDAQPDNSFAPTLQQYETFLQSLQITAPTRRIF